MRRIVIILAISICIGCTTTSNVTTTNPIAENNKDVLILSTLIRGHLKRTNGRVFSLNELAQIDTLKRISNNFEKTELKTHGGYISVYYKFSKSRNSSKIELTNKEREMLNWKNWKAKKMNDQYDGEIQFSYPERFYSFRKIIIKKEI